MFQAAMKIIILIINLNYKFLNLNLNIINQKVNEHDLVSLAENLNALRC